MHAAAKAADGAVASSGSVLWALAAGRATSRPQEQQAKDVHDHHDHSHHMAIVLALVQNLGLLAVGKDDIDEDAVKDVIERDDLVGKPVDCNGFAAAPLTAKSIENGAETLAKTALLVVEDPGEDALAALEKVYDARSSLAADKAAGMVYYTLRLPALSAFAAEAIQNQTARLEMAWKLARSLKRAGHVISVVYYQHETQIGIALAAESASSSGAEKTTKASKAQVGVPEPLPQRTGWGGSARTRTANRFTVFREWLETTFGLEALRANGGVLDVAGGKGDLAFKLLIHAGVPTTIVDPRPMDVPNMLRHVTRALVHRLAQQIDEDAKDARPLVVLPFPKHIRTWFWYPLSKSMGAAPESYVNDPLQPVPVEASGLEAALQSCSAIVGMHSDQATEAIVDWGLELGKPFAVVPCCVFPNLFPERGNVRKHPEFLRYLVHKDPLRVCREKLSFAGRNDVVFGHRKNEAESTTLPGDTIDSDKSSGSDAFKDSDMPNGEDGDNGKHGDDGNMGDDAKDTEDAECCDEDDQHRSKSSNGCVPSDVDSDQAQFRSTSEVVILPWSPLAMHLQDTGEDDGAVYGSLAQELGSENAPLRSESPTEEEAFVKAAKEKAAGEGDSQVEDQTLSQSDGDDDDDGDDNETDMRFPPWMRVPRACPASKLAQRPWSHFQESQLVFVVLRWYFAHAMLGLCLEFRWRSVIFGFMLALLLLQESQLRKLVRTWTMGPHVAIAEACEDFEIEIVRLVWAIKRRELQRRGFALRGLAPPISRIERNQCLRTPEARVELQAPAIRKRLLASLRAATQILNGAARVSTSTSIEEVPLLTEIERSLRSFFRTRARFASNVRFLRVTEEDLLRVARLLRNEMHSLWASSEATIQVEDINQVPQQIRSPKDTEALRMIRANLENLRQGLAGVEAVLWACEEDLIDDCRDTSRVHSLVDELGATWQQFQPDGAKAVQGAMHLAHTLASKRGLSAPAAQGLHWTTDAYGTGVRVNDDEDDDFGSQSSNEPATVEVDDVERAAALSQPFTDVYQGFVEEPRPRRRGPAPLDDPASLEAREAAKVASNMLGELGSVLSHHRSGLAPERVVRTEGKAPSARDTKNAKRRDRVQMETSHDAVPATEAHAVVGELARLLAAMPQRLDDDTQFS